ncbi:hypothetical protein BST97_06840 [Nonlabens spongiae]|uniref:Lipocalin-like domain-containing protein n=2 Tax=Nonlabens spongiae TaxID=331648 RepID=A0A1W6MJQ2_9FLAO|nr:hypothetical protein BST97_06840 [Nonlabens spongiae]
MLLISCGSKQSTVSIAGREIDKKEFKGNWTLASVDFDGYRKYNVTLFNDTDTDCFLVSDWNFVSNNNKGSYEITSNSCETGKRYFIWVLDSASRTFKLKPTDEDYNSVDDLGYTLNIKSVSENQIILGQRLTIDGGPVNMELKLIRTTLNQ